MSEISASELGSNWFQILRRAQAGERFVITECNRPVAELIPFLSAGADRVRDAIKGLISFQNTHRLEGLSVRQMIEEGRRHWRGQLTSIGGRHWLAAHRLSTRYSQLCPQEGTP